MARFTGGQVILSEVDLDRSPQKLLEYRMAPTHDTETLLTAFQENRTKCLADLISACELLSATAASIVTLCSRYGKQLRFDSCNICEILAESIRRLFAHKLNALHGKHWTSEFVNSISSAF